MKLPRCVKAALIAANFYNCMYKAFLSFLITVSCLFTIWWLSQSDLQPDDFILPPVFAEFPDYSIHNEDDNLMLHLINYNRETELGRVVARVWSFIPSVNQSLMVYC